MPRITDRAAIRSLLETDRPWAVYALGDLAPGFFEHCEWFGTTKRAPALALLYRAFDTPVLFALGEAATVEGILEEISPEPRLYLSIRPEILPLIKARYRVSHEQAMWRMILDPAHFRPEPAEGCVRLGPADRPELEQLYADGEATGEGPDFFTPAMLEEGVFFGVREKEGLVAAAGTHLVVPAEGVAAIGNVYTRRDRRGRGFAGQATSAVVRELLRMNLRTVALNVAQNNAAALRVYERLGFARYGAFYEGVAERGGPSHP
jgi:ribosomal protein S18 acetylase RimI-like enzyme